MLPRYKLNGFFFEPPLNSSNSILCLEVPLVKKKYVMQSLFLLIHSRRILIMSATCAFYLRTATDIMSL